MDKYIISYQNLNVHEKYNTKYCKKNKIMLRKISFWWLNNSIINSIIKDLKYNFNVIILHLINIDINKFDVLKYCYNLKDVDITNNKIKCIKFTKSLINLEKFNCDLNDIKSIDSLKFCSKLKKLDCSRNKNLKNINVLKYLKNLEYFACIGPNIDIKSICNLKHNTKLRELHIHLNQLTYLNGLKYCQNLNILMLYNSLKLNKNIVYDILLLENLKRIEYSYQVDWLDVKNFLQERLKNNVSVSVDSRYK